MEAALRALLIGYAPLTALVPAAQIVWNHLPQSTPRPAIVLYKISGAPGITMQGSDGLEASRVQIDVQAATVTAMWNVRDAIVTRLHGYRGGVFKGIHMLGEQQDSEQATNGLIHRASLDFGIWASA